MRDLVSDMVLAIVVRAGWSFSGFWNRLCRARNWCREECVLFLREKVMKHAAMNRYIPCCADPQVHS